MRGKWYRALLRMRTNIAQVLAINQRNLRYVYTYNPRRHFPVADDKSLTKALLARHGISVPETYAVYQWFYQLARLPGDLDGIDEFVIKPAGGRGGGGIQVVTRLDSGRFQSGGEILGWGELRQHLADILFGVYSSGYTDRAIIEERLHPHHRLKKLSPFGLPDIRILLWREQPALAMLRIPTRRSRGKANLHQGAIGVGIGLAHGITTHAIAGTQRIVDHPDTGERLIPFTIPCWQETVSLAVAAARQVHLKYLGVDISITDTGPRILELNARPGLQIQLANQTGLRSILAQLEAESPADDEL